MPPIMLNIFAHRAYALREGGLYLCKELSYVRAEQYSGNVTHKMRGTYN